MHRRTIFLLLAVPLVIGCGAAFAVWRFYHGTTALPPEYYAAQNHKPRGIIPTLDHIVVIVEENKSRALITGGTGAPYIQTLLHAGSTATHYYAVAHPSLPNYIALTSGTTAGITSDCSPLSTSCRADVPNIADSLERAHKTWKAYVESMPAPCTTNSSGGYAVKHNPFMYYPALRSNAARCDAHDVPFSRFTSDIANTATLPDFSFIVPNLCDDMHDCSVRTGDNWLAAYVPTILASPAFTHQHSLLVIVWDEADNSNGNNVPVIFAGPAAKIGFTSNAYYSHYSLLHTIEGAWHLPPLTSNDRAAPVMTDMLQ